VRANDGNAIAKKIILLSKTRKHLALFPKLLRGVPSHHPIVAGSFSLNSHVRLLFTLKENSNLDHDEKFTGKDTGV
jgi:hypothetical protein